ncbi:unnamed protein product [Clavelina lepadiformis]|uniref:prostaglandin-endoperoxide synthase n=1 Tax=Clavelina lepadiformis TaxID=159417 RepID=A0ABP0H0K5_CLALP
MLLYCYLLLYTTSAIASANESTAALTEDFNPCCSFPCQHNSVCMALASNSYECDCTTTGYYGANCETPYISTTVVSWLKPSKTTLHYTLTHFPWIWKIVNSISLLRRFLMKAVLKVRIGSIVEPSPYGALTSYPSWETYSNKSTYVRTLPAVPENCPTPMGVKGKKYFPDADMLVETLFRRRKFEPSPIRTSLVFPLFAQHFTHQFFKTNTSKGLPHQWGQQSVDLSHIYGHTQERQHALRLHIDGKMKSSNIGGEMFPPLVEDAQVLMDGIDKVPQEYRFAIGHPGFTMQPPLLFFATLWLREHNRVCDILKAEHPNWDDERLFQTARLILTGETIKVVIEDYVQHISGYSYKLIYDPELIFGAGFSYHNEIAVEFQLLYRWHALMPDDLTINNQAYPIRNLIFNPKPFVDSGMATLVKDMTSQFASKVAGGNSQGVATLGVARQAIIDGRRLRLQPFNKYRERFGMTPYKSFNEFTDDPNMARALEEHYGDIDAVEFFVGIMLEKRRSSQLFGQTLTEVGSPYSLKGLFGNPIGSPAWWKPSTFGGKKGFDIIKTTSLQALVCRNVEGCPRISFEVPVGIAYRPNVNDTQSIHRNDNSSEILMKINRGYHVEDQIIEHSIITSDVQKETAISDSPNRHKTEL